MSPLTAWQSSAPRFSVVTLLPNLLCGKQSPYSPIPSHHRQQRLCGIELLGIGVQCWLLHLSVREKLSKSSSLTPHPDTHPAPHSTHSATGPSSLSSPLMRPTGGLPVWLGQGGGGWSGPSVPPAGGRGSLSSLSNMDSVLEETGDPMDSEVNRPSTSFSFPLASSFKIRGEKGSRLVSGELLGWSWKERTTHTALSSPDPRPCFLLSSLLSLLLIHLILCLFTYAPSTFFNFN